MHDLPFIQYNATEVSPRSARSTRSARSVQGQQGQSNDRKVSPRTARSVKVKQSLSKVTQQGQSRSVQGYPRSAKVIKGHNFNMDLDGETDRQTNMVRKGIELLMAVNKLPRISGLM